MAKIKSSIDEEPADSFTSMIDIVFLLLIFFILQPFKSPERRLKSELPRDQGPSSAVPKDTQNVMLEVRTRPNEPDGAYYKLGGSIVSDKDKLYRELLKHAARDTTSPVVIDADRAVHFQWVLKALDQCYLAEMTNVNFSAPPPPGAKENEYMETRRERDFRRAE